MLRRIVNSQARRLVPSTKEPSLLHALTERFLNEIVGAIKIAAQRHGESAQIGDDREDVGRHLSAGHGIGGRRLLSLRRRGRPSARSSRSVLLQLRSADPFELPQKIEETLGDRLRQDVVVDASQPKTDLIGDFAPACRISANGRRGQERPPRTHSKSDRRLASRNVHLTGSPPP